MLRKNKTKTFLDGKERLLVIAAKIMTQVLQPATTIFNGQPVGYISSRRETRRDVILTFAINSFTINLNFKEEA